MNISFDIKESLQLNSLYFKDTSTYNSNETIVGYNLSYSEYLTEGDSVSYSYTITEDAELEKMLSGGYFPIESFINTLGEFKTSIKDDSYHITMTVDYEADLIPGSESLTQIVLFYQNVLNLYSVSHLRYEWNKKLQGDSEEVLKMAEELT